MLEGGYHLLLDLEGCDRRRLDSPSAMRRTCEDLARLLGARILKSVVHRFSPKGVTAFVLIAESHVSVHTWPESGKAFLDVFTCKESFDVERVLDHVLGALGAKRGRANMFLRDTQSNRLVFSRTLPTASLRLDFGRSIYRTRSPFQLIELTRGPMGVSLFLDGYWQFVERYEHIYHETLVHPALVCAPRLRKVGIGGGGDALALREVLRYPELGRVEMYEIDAKVLDVARTHPEMIRLNKRALDHRKSKVVSDDARKMLRPGAAYDALVFDFPSLSDGGRYGKLYGASHYQRARKALAPEGVLVTQITDFARNFLQTERNLRRVFAHVRPMHVLMPHSVFSFILASPAPIRQRRPLPPGLRFLDEHRLRRLLTRGAVLRGRRPGRVAA